METDKLAVEQLFEFQALSPCRPLCANTPSCQRGIQKTHKTCPDQKRTSAPRSTKLNRFSCKVWGTSVRVEALHTWEILNIPKQRSHILCKWTFIKAASLLPPLWARWCWNVAERQVFGRTLLFCFFLSCLGLCSQLTCEEATADSLTLKNFWSNANKFYI